MSEAPGHSSHANFSRCKSGQLARRGHYVRRMEARPRRPGRHASSMLSSLFVLWDVCTSRLRLMLRNELHQASLNFFHSFISSSYSFRTSFTKRGCTLTVATIVSGSSPDLQSSRIFAATSPSTNCVETCWTTPDFKGCDWRTWPPRLLPSLKVLPQYLQGNSASSADVKPFGSSASSTS
jgi:hypothetical protein